MKHESTDSSPKRRCCDVAADTLSSSSWEQRYQDGQTGWDRGEPNPQLNNWLDRLLSPPKSVLVPGCGRGHEAIALARAGFQVTAIDFADSAVAALRRKCQQEGVEVEVIHSDLFAYAPERDFDVIYEQTCLCAIHPSQWRTYEQRLASWLRPGGHLLAMFMQSNLENGPPFHCHLDAMRELFREDQWEWEAEMNQVPHPTGMSEIACHLRKV